MALLSLFHAALLGIAKETAFVLTNPLFSNRKHHVDSFPATVKSRLQHCFFFQRAVLSWTLVEYCKLLYARISLVDLLN